MRAPFERRRTEVAAALIAALVFLDTSAWARPAAPPVRSDEAREVAFLIHAGTADSLAAASLLAHLVPHPDGSEVAAGPDPTRLIDQAVALAPARPDLVWLQLRDCERRRCPTAARLAERLESLDPENGFAFSTELRTVPDLPAGDATRILERMGAARNPRLYWNRLTAALFEALTHRDRAAPPTEITRAPDDRLQRVTGLLAAVDVPAVAPVARYCRLDQFELPGRRAACVSVMSRLAVSDSVIAQNMSLTVQESWWPVGVAERVTLHRLREQHRYLTVASNRLRPGLADRDATRRVDAMRRLPLEEDVERAMLEDFHEPLQRPSDWQEPTAAP